MIVVITKYKILLPTEVDEEATEIFAVLLDAVVERFDLFLLEEPQNVFLELSRSFARNDLDHRRVLLHCFFDNIVQRFVNIAPFIEDVVQIEFEFHLLRLLVKEKLAEHRKDEEKQDA